MAAEAIEMPKMSDTMTEGMLVSWQKKVGDSIKAGDILAEVETDKATMEMESYADGILLHIAVEAGKAVPVSGLIAIIGKKEDKFDDILAKYSGKPSAVVAAPEPVIASQLIEQKAVIVSQPILTSTSIGSETLYIAAQTNGSQDNRLKASPLAKAVAQEKGIDLQQVKGSGEGGRIVKRDIEKAVTMGVSTPVSTMQTVTAGSYEEVTISQMRKTIARRLAESKFTSPHYYLTMAMEMDAAVKFREQLNAESDVKISYNDLVIKAVAIGLRKHPKIMSNWLGDKIRYNYQINIGMAVAVEDGLLVPVIRNADNKGLSQIAKEAKEFSQRAKNKQLQPQDWEGNTFTISNLGMFGIEEFTAIINPPDACILAVGGIIQQPVVRNNTIEIGQMMKVTLSCDHRLVDGAMGSAFLQTVKYLLENPLRLLL